MTLYLLLAVGFIYLMILFIMAYLTEMGVISEKLVSHPIVYTLSLGVYASAWAVYGAVGFAYHEGFSFLAYFFGISGAFLVLPIMVKPLMHLVKAHQFVSLADLFTYRYRSKISGSLVAIIMLLSLIPLITLQIQAVAQSIALLTKSTSTPLFAAMFISMIILFTLLFGARSANSRERHPGLVIAIAFETLIKVAALVLIAGYSLHHVFGGFGGLEQWLIENPKYLAVTEGPKQEGQWRLLLLPFFLSALTMPHMFHMTFAEHPSTKAWRNSSWGFPMIMMIMAFTVPIILWSSIKAQVPTDPEYFTLGLGVAIQAPFLSVIAFLAGLSAASGVMVVVTLSLSIMMLNHLILPYRQASPQKDFYLWLLQMRRVLIIVILTAAYLFYLLIDNRQNLTQLGLLSFLGTLQFAPGLIGVLLWPRATKQGFITGLLVGFSIWLILLLAPTTGFSPISLAIEFYNNSTNSLDKWQLPSIFATLANTFCFIFISLLSKQSETEKQAASACTIINSKSALRSELSAISANEFTQQLAEHLGEVVAEREVSQALNDLELGKNESRPYALRRLREKVEYNLSGLLGTSTAQDIVERCLPYKSESELITHNDIYFMEKRVESYKNRLTGLAKELDDLRRFHRQVINDLPIGVCSLANFKEIVNWNRSLEFITGITGQNAIGSCAWHLPNPWGDLLADILELPSNDLCTQRELEFRGQLRQYKIHKAFVYTKCRTKNEGNLVLVIEDVTQFHTLEQKIAHNQRLASIGKLAAGVAHEIGNPITGIACLAQDICSELLEKSDNNDPLKIEGSSENTSSYLNLYSEKRSALCSHDRIIMDMATQIHNQTQRISRIVHSLVSFSHSGQSHQKSLSKINLFDIVKESIDLILLAPEQCQVNYINLCNKTLNILGDHQLMVQVFINLLSNASDALEQKGEVTITTSCRTDTITVTVSDKGCGIPNDILPTVFDPFVTTKSPGKGTGLGLALVYRFITGQGGSIEIQSPSLTHASATGRGTNVLITMPSAHA